MIKMYKSGTGQFVLVHPPTQTFIMGDRLEEAYARLLEQVDAHHPEQSGEVMNPMEKPRPASGANARIAQLVLIVFLALLPFVWLLAMHYALSSLLTGFYESRPESAVQAGSQHDLMTEEFELLRLEHNRVLGEVYFLKQQLEAALAAGMTDKAQETNNAEEELPAKEEDASSGRPPES